MFIFSRIASGFHLKDKGMLVHISGNIFSFISLWFEMILMQNILFHQLLYWKDVKWPFKWNVHCLWFGEKSEEGQQNALAESPWVMTLFTAPMSYTIIKSHLWRPADPTVKVAASSSSQLLWSPLRQTGRHAHTQLSGHFTPLQVSLGDLRYCSCAHSVAAHSPVTDTADTQTLQPVGWLPLVHPEPHIHTRT